MLNSDVVKGFGIARHVNNVTKHYIIDKSTLLYSASPAQREGAGRVWAAGRARGRSAPRQEQRVAMACPLCRDPLQGGSPLLVAHRLPRAAKVSEGAPGVRCADDSRGRVIAPSLRAFPSSLLSGSRNPRPSMTGSRRANRLVTGISKGAEHVTSPRGDEGDQRSHNRRLACVRRRVGEFRQQLDAFG